jgi:hypothetical protein
VFDEALRLGLAVQLEQSPFLSIVTEARIRSALQLMGQPSGTPLTGDVARDLCVRTGSMAVVTGSIASLGTQYVLGLRAEHCGNGDLLGQEQLTAARKEDVLNVLSQLATKFRTRAGESLVTVQKHSTPLQEATTPSLDALKAYSAAMKSVKQRAHRSPAPQTRARDRSEFRDRACAAGLALQRHRRVAPRRKEHEQGLRAARIVPTTASASSSPPSTTGR